MNKKIRKKEILERLGFSEDVITRFQQDKCTEEEIVEIRKRIYKRNIPATILFFVIFCLPLLSFMIFGTMSCVSVDRSDCLNFLQLIVLVGGLDLTICMLILERDVPKNKFADKRATMHRYKIKNEEDGVEGIIDGKQYDLLDKDQDGRIMMHEFYPLTEDEVIQKILEVDGNFSKTEFKVYVKKIFLIIQESFAAKNVHKLRSFESDDLYNQHKLYIEGLISREEIDERKNIDIKGVVLKDFKIDGGRQILTVALTAGMSRTVSNRYSNCNGNVPYILIFARNIGVKTKLDTSLSTTNCSNCGAVIDVDDNGICKYCGSSLVSGETDWVLIDIKDIKLIKG